jgi:3-phosphoshikimate 1-carboxyvinyltransferase
MSSNENNNVLVVQPSRRIEGEIQMPGDKSISHRAVIFAGLADGTSRVTNFLPGEDCLCSLAAMQAFGASIELIDSTTLLVHGVAGKLRPALEPIDCGNSGTSMRLLSGVLAGQPFRSVLYGDRSLSSRPMKRIIDPLTQMGAEIAGQGPKGFAPLHITGKPLKGIEYNLPMASAQLKTCLLLAGLFANGTTSVTEPTQSRDHTERLFEHFHAPLNKEGRALRVRGGTTLHGRDLLVPGDFSSAAFWIVAAAAMSGSSLTLTRVGLNPTRTGLLSVLLRMGGQIRETIEDNAAEPYGTLQVVGRQLRGTHIGGEEIANVIDELPILAVAAALAEGETVISNAEELRVKETDRIAAMAANLRAFGVPVEEKPDGMIIQGGAPLNGAQVESFGDHRIAMSCAILALFSRGPSRITDTGCIATSYPTFVQDLEQLTDQTAMHLGAMVGSVVTMGRSNRARS